MQRKAARESGSRELQAYEIRLLRKDGNVRLFEVRADAVEYQGCIASTGTMRDITDAKAQQVALAKAERRYRVHWLQHHLLPAVRRRPVILGHQKWMPPM